MSPGAPPVSEHGLDASDTEEIRHAGSPRLALRQKDSGGRTQTVATNRRVSSSGKWGATLTCRSFGDFGANFFGPPLSLCDSRQRESQGCMGAALIPRHLAIL